MQKEGEEADDEAEGEEEDDETKKAEWDKTKETTKVRATVYVAVAYILHSSMCPQGSHPRCPHLSSLSMLILRSSHLRREQRET